MTAQATPVAAHGLRAGDLVVVRPAEQILLTLDDRGRLDGMPFMPEMLQYCGRRFRVVKRADKTCDPVTKERGGHIRRLHDTVHLEGLRCDGSAHGGCEALCNLYWKEAWLAPVDDLSTSTASTNGVVPAGGSMLPTVQPVTHETLEAATVVSGDETDGTAIYSCQATEVVAATERMPWWSPQQYVRDVRSGNVRLRELLVGLGIMLFNKVQAANEVFLPGVKLIKRGRRYPFFEGKAKGRTPHESLDLQPGELVRVKSLEEIEQTLNAESENRGLRFSLEMVKYCGRTTRVARRVHRIIDEDSGEVITMKNACIILEDVICTGQCFQMCPRSTYPYWHEIWLERVE